jgi:hypothetical protein
MPPKAGAVAAPAPGDAALLPDKFEEFRSLSYWDGFFKEARLRKPPRLLAAAQYAPGRSDASAAALQRGAVPFEWYSEWAQLARCCAPPWARTRRDMQPPHLTAQLAAASSLSAAVPSFRADVRRRLRNITNIHSRKARPDPSPSPCKSAP